MTRYPRRDVVLVAVSAQDGGCGASHMRPVTHGVPDPNWELVCPPCEKALEGDPRWAKTRAEVPETPDETMKRESLKNQKDRNLEEIQTAALAKMAGFDYVDPSIRRGELRGQQTICKSGHENPSSSKFCSECGISLTADDVGIMKIAMPKMATVVKPDYSIMTVATLRTLAEQNGINPKQSKKQLIEALS